MGSISYHVIPSKIIIIMWFIARTKIPVTNTGIINFEIASIGILNIALIPTFMRPITAFILTEEMEISSCRPYV